MDQRDYDRATKLRLLASDLHAAILDAREAGLEVEWHIDFSRHASGITPVHNRPGDDTFDPAHLEISRTTVL